MRIYETFFIVIGRFIKLVSDFCYKNVVDIRIGCFISYWHIDVCILDAVLLTFKETFVEYLTLRRCRVS